MGNRDKFEDQRETIMFFPLFRHCATLHWHFTPPVRPGSLASLVGTWCWQLKHVSVTGASDSSDGTTSCVATAGGALWVGPTSGKRRRRA